MTMIKKTDIKTDPALLEAIARSKDHVAAMSNEEREAMHKAQRESWARANVSTGDPRWD